MTEAKVTAIRNDAKAQRLRNLETAILKVLAGLVVFAILVASVSGSIAAIEIHANSNQNHTLIQQIAEITSQHSSTINATLVLQKDLDHKFVVFKTVIAASCEAERQQGAPKSSVAACDRLLAKVTAIVEANPSPTP